jgi:hypothetical protein
VLAERFLLLPMVPRRCLSLADNTQSARRIFCITHFLLLKLANLHQHRV